MEKGKVQKSGLLLFFYLSNGILLPELSRKALASIMEYEVLWQSGCSNQ